MTESSVRLTCRTCGAVHLCQDNARVVASAFRCLINGCRGVVTYPGAVAEFEPDDGALRLIAVTGMLADAPDDEAALMDLPADEWLRRCILGQREFKGYVIRDLAMRHFEIRHTVRFVDCVLHRPVFNSVHFDEPVQFINCRVIDAVFDECQFTGKDPERGDHDALRFDGSTIEGALTLQDCAIRRGRMVDCQLVPGGGDDRDDARGDGVTIKGGAIDGPFTFDDLDVGTDLELRGLVAAGALSIERCRFDADLRLIDVDIRAPFTLARCEFDDTGYLTLDDVRFHGGRAQLVDILAFRPLRLRGCLAECDIELDGVRLFPGVIDFDIDHRRPQDVFRQPAMVLTDTRLHAALRVTDSVIVGEWDLTDTHLHALDMSHRPLADMRPGRSEWTAWVDRLEYLQVEAHTGMNLARAEQFVGMIASLEMARREKLLHDATTGLLGARRALLAIRVAVPEQIPEARWWFREAARKLATLPTSLSEIDAQETANARDRVLPPGVSLPSLVSAYERLLMQWWLVYLWGVHSQALPHGHRLRAIGATSVHQGRTFEMLQRAFGEAGNSNGVAWGARMASEARIRELTRAYEDQQREFPAAVKAARRYSWMATGGLAVALIGVWSLIVGGQLDSLLLVGGAFYGTVLWYWIREPEPGMLLRRRFALTRLRVEGRVSGHVTQPGRALAWLLGTFGVFALIYAVASGFDLVGSSTGRAYSDVALLNHLLIGFDMAFRALWPTDLAVQHAGLIAVAWLQRLASLYLVVMMLLSLRPRSTTVA